MDSPMRLMPVFRRLSFLAFVVVLAALGAAWALPCPFCKWWNPDGVTICRRCLRAVAWPEKPPRSHQGRIIVRYGHDVGIAGPDENRHPRQRADLNTGADTLYHLGSGNNPTGYRYLVRFDIPEAFARAGRSLNGFSLSRATLVIRPVPGDDAREPVPIKVFALSRSFEEGTGRWNWHQQGDGGATWYRATPHLPWAHAGGDFILKPAAAGLLPRLESGDVMIDVTPLMAIRFASFRKTGIWDDPGFLLMRDSTSDARCLSRRIYGFGSDPGPGPTGVDRPLRSPELFLE